MIRSIVVGTDGSDTAAKAVEEAGAIAAKLGATVHVVTAYSPGEPGVINGILDHARESLSEAGVQDIHTCLLYTSDAADE